MALTQKGVAIQAAVKAAHRGWSSRDKLKKVARSVETSDRPSTTLKKTNLPSAIILQSDLIFLVTSHFSNSKGLIWLYLILKMQLWIKFRKILNVNLLFLL